MALADFKTIESPKLKLDLGCGKNKREGFHGVDSISFEGVDTIVDLSKGNWPWQDNSVEEAHCSHFIEHLTALERVVFVNELYRILEPSGKCQIIIPHWASSRAYGDFTHQWPPVSEMWFYYLKREWRLGTDKISPNAPHTDISYNPAGYSCDFDATWGYNLRQDLMTRNQEYQMFAVQNYKEVCQDIIATLVKR